MRRGARRALPALLAALLLPLASPPARAAGEPAATTLTGTYEVLAKDTFTPGGELAHTYTEVLRTPGRAVPVRFPEGHGLRPATTVEVTTGDSGTSVRELGAGRTTAATTGSTSLIVILAYWTKPDAVTQARATSQVFGDDNRWFREVSYGKAGLTGVVTPWVRIPAPKDGQCYTHAEKMLADARSAAAALGGVYDPWVYERTMLYFPRCSGADSRNVAGWAYEPGYASWVNGYMDRRTTVHEQGHNYGLGHAKSYRCTTAGGTPVTFGSRCAASEYGDPYDAMGRSSYAAHFSGPRKDRAGWLGSRKRVLTSSAPTTFNLPPLERSSTVPVVVVAKSPSVSSRSYWFEYRRPIGMDATLPSGATGGVLVHLEDSGKPGWLLDGTPADRTMSTAVLRPGTTWTSPDRVKVTVVSITSVQARVTVTGARPAPAVPSAPRNLVAKPSDSRVTLTWSAPYSPGGAPVTAYDVAGTSSRGTVSRTVGASTLSTTFSSLANGVTYTFTVRARNEGGAGPAATASATPIELSPTVRLTSPAPGAVLRGYASLAADSTPNPDSYAAVHQLRFYLDGRHYSTYYGSAGSVALYTPNLTNGPHDVYVVAVDAQNRYATSATHSFTVDNPRPVVRITSPVTGTTTDGERVTLAANATMPDTSATVTRVDFLDVTGGYETLVAVTWWAPFTTTWQVGHIEGTRTIVARAHASNGTTAESAPVLVTIDHPPTTVTLSPATGTVLSGTQVRLAAGVTVTAPESAVSYVTFVSSVAGSLGTDHTAPYELAWDTSALSGTHDVYATVYETTGRSARSATHQITLANALPTVAITSPAYGDSVLPGTVRVTGTAHPGQGGERPDRVELAVDSVLVATVPVADDGTWSHDLSLAKPYGWRSLAATARTPGGLRRVESTGIVVTAPVPSMTVHEPAPYTQVGYGAYYDVVVSAAPAAGDTAGVWRVCVGDYWTTCDDTPGTDGRYVVRMQSQQIGQRTLGITVVMTDGYQHYFTGPVITS